MSLFGKILAGLNIIAAAIFAFLVVVDWGQRQSWTYAVFRQDLAISGLPVDDKEKDAEGVRAVDRISDPTMQDLFRPVGGVPANLPAEEKTQTAEVRRTENRLRSEIEALPDNQKQAKLLAILTPLATTEGERRKVPTLDLKGLQAEFERVFRAPLEKNDVEDKRRAIAHLLLNLASSRPDATDYQRALTVVGLKAFTAEADRQALALRDMAQEVALETARDEGDFVRNFHQVESELRELTTVLNQRQTALKEQSDITKRQQALLKDRKDVYEDLQKRIEKTRQGAKETLAQLTARQELLYKTQHDVKTTADGNKALELKLRQLEKVNP